MMKTIAALLLSIVLATGAQAQSVKELWCRTQAAEVFAKGWSQPPSYNANYENHFSLRLNKCFYIEVTNAEKGSFRSMRLYDLYENREMASYDKWADTVVYCLVQGKDCKSEDEWRALVKRFMED